MSDRITLQRAGQFKAPYAVFLSSVITFTGFILIPLCIASAEDKAAQVVLQTPSAIPSVSSVTGNAGSAQIAPSVVSTPKDYLIGSEDVLEISVWGEPDLSKAFAVSPEGTINYPLLGPVQVGGITPESLETLLRDKLSQGFLKDPKITVSIKEFNSKKIMVFGLVGAPGLYKVRGALPLLELLFMVGNVTSESGTRLVVMRRASDAQDAQPKPVAEVNLDDLLLKGDLTKNILIQPGDFVYVTPAQASDRRRFYVMGQVKSAGPFDYTKPLTLLEAIKLAGGLTDYASPRRIQVIRKEGDKKVTLKFNLNEITSGKKADDFLVQPGDVIVVPESWF